MTEAAAGRAASSRPARDNRPAGAGPLPRLFRLLPGPVHGTLPAPPSKSYTHRALLAGALATGPLHILHPSTCADTRASRSAVEAIGGKVRTVPGPTGRAGDASWEVQPAPADAAPGGTERVAAVEESGTTLRLFTAAAALGAPWVRFEGSAGLARRPMGGLLEALDNLGAGREGPPPGASLPFRIHGPIRAGTVRVPVGVSSQFLSALLMALPCLEGESHLRTDGVPVSTPYVEATLAVMRAQGMRVEVVPGGYRLPGGQRYAARPMEVPGDASTAANWFVLAALTGGPVRVTGLPAAWPQADLALLDILKKAGCQVERSGEDDAVEVRRGSGPLRPFQADLDPSPDLAPLLAVLGSFAPGRSELRGGAHLRSKESDRRAGSLALARALGARASEADGRIVIEGPCVARRLELTALSDHRMLFAAAVAASALPEPSLLGDGTACVKSHPGFLDDLGTLGIAIEPVPPDTRDRSGGAQESVRRPVAERGSAGGYP